MSATPPDSRPGSPVLKAPRRQLQVEDGETRKSDKAYKRYSADIERALASFEPSARVEWPDYISFLGRLLKAVQSYPNGKNDLPHKSEVASRLSQCLKPTLPSGVHQKALDVYAIIFELIGRRRLGNDLPIFLPGLVGVLGFASLSLRPAYLSLIETHVSPLPGQQLRPALKALILSLLPGVEEENGEDFERSLSLIDNLQSATSSDTGRDAKSFPEPHNAFFWQCFFLASIGSTSRRQGALAFLVRRLPKLVPQKDLHSAESDMPTTDSGLDPEAEAAVSPEPGLLIRCFATGLEDDQILVQRGFLDLLLTHLPLHSPVLVTRASRGDANRLVTAAVSVVARKDMSLNRRLWSWFLGPQASHETEEKADSQSPEPSRAQPQNPSDQGIDYLHQYGLDVLVKAVLGMLSQRPSKPNARAKPFRICLSLLDRSDIGGAIVPQTIRPALLNIQDYVRFARSEDFDEVLRSASGFFDGIEGSTLWGQIAKLGYQGMVASSDQQRQRPVEMAQLMLDRFNVREEDMIRTHVPRVSLLFLALLNRQQTEAEAEDEAHAGKFQSEHTETLLATVVACLPTLSVELNGSRLPATVLSKDSGINSDNDIINTLWKAYGSNEHAALLPLTQDEVSSALLRHSKQLLVRALEDKTPMPRECVVRRSRIFAGVLAKVQYRPQHMVAELVAAFETYLQRRTRTPSDCHFSSFVAPFEVLHALLSVTVTMVSGDASGTWRQLDAFSGLVQNMVQGFWGNLSPSRPRYHLEAIHCLWQLQDLLGQEHSVEAAIASLLSGVSMKDHDELSILEHARRFAILWNHTTTKSAHSGKRPGVYRLQSSQATSFSSAQKMLSDYQENLYRPLFLLFDLAEDNPELSDFLHTSFLRPSIASKVLEVLLNRVQRAHGVAFDQSTEQPASDTGPYSAHANRDPECLYYLQRIAKVLKHGTSQTWKALEEKYRPHPSSGVDHDNHSIIEGIGHTCMDIVQSHFFAATSSMRNCSQSLILTSLSILRQCCTDSNSAALGSLELASPSIAMLRRQLRGPIDDTSIQTALLETILAVLRARSNLQHYVDSGGKTYPSKSSENISNGGRTRPPQSAGIESHPGKATATLEAETASQLTHCLQEGLEAASSVFILEHWIQFMIEALPHMAQTLFQSAIPLVETLCKRVRQISHNLNSSFAVSGGDIEAAPESGLIALLNGLQYLLATAHDRLSLEESRQTQSRSPEPTQSFFGNVAGVFSAETQKPRTATGNTRLTVILCFQDALRVCLSIWSWGAYGGMQDAPDPTCLASFAYVSQRLRNQTRKMLDWMFSIEGLECLETLVADWIPRGSKGEKSSNPPTISLLHVLDSSSPKQTMPALFNSIYSRTSPSSIDASRLSTLTSDITDVDLARFLIEYTMSLDDDAMDEIWTDCMTFLRDVLANPLPHSQILPLLLHFLVTLARKVDRTNFGEQRKMRKDLADLFGRLLGAVFTTRGAGLQREADASDPDKAVDVPASKGRSRKRKPRGTDVVHIMDEIIPRLSMVLQDNDRISNAVSVISSNLITPLVHSKTFPENARAEYLVILQRLSDLPLATTKSIRKDLADVFSHPRLFSASTTHALRHLIPLTHSVSVTDKDALPSLLTRLNPPATAGIMFGVGATAARTESDKKTQLALRRAALLVVSADLDFAAAHIALLEEKLSDLLLATPASSPSSTTRAEVFMLLRALVLNTSAIHLASLWPLITSELQKALSSALPRSTEWETYNVPSLLQACKLLDCLLLVAPDEFQMLEWLFVTDSVEAVYRPGVATAAVAEGSEPVALCDDLAEELSSAGLDDGAEGDALVPATPADELANLALSPVRSREKKQDVSDSSQPTNHLLALDTNTVNMTTEEPRQLKKPLLRIPQSELETLTTTPKAEFVGRVLRPWFARLSMHAYECAYAMRPADMEGLKRAVLEDMFDGGRGIVG